MSFKDDLLNIYSAKQLNQATTLFFDRDGTLNKSAPPSPHDPLNTGYVLSWDEWQFCDNVIDGLKKLTVQGFSMHIYTQQSGIGKGCMSTRDLEDIHHNMRANLKKNGVYFDKITYCPHTTDSTGKYTCEDTPHPCAKLNFDSTPNHYQGMIGKLLNATHTKPHHVICIGDSTRDIPPQNMRDAGMMFIGVANTASGKEKQSDKIRKKGFPVAQDLIEIADILYRIK